MPEYRKTTGMARGFLLGIGGSQLNDQPLPASILDPEHRHFASELRLVQPIAAYSVKDEAVNGRIDWPPDLVARYQPKFFKGWVLNRAWIEVPASCVNGLLDTVRTRILKFALEIKAQLPDETDQAIERIPQARVDQILQYAIYGGNVVIGNVTQFNPQTVVAGNIQSLKAALVGLGISSDDIAQLEKTLNDEKSTTRTESQALSGKLLEWVKNMAQKIGNGAVTISVAVAEEAIRAAVKKYLGY